MLFVAVPSTNPSGLHFVLQAIALSSIYTSIIHIVTPMVYYQIDNKFFTYYNQ
jgi:hypothetical protein